MSLALLQRGQSQTKKPWMVPDSLTHNAGTIAAVFGSTIYSVILSGLVANTRYQLYIVPGGTLVFSVNEHSVGPAGYTSWILVGSFYTNYTPAFGAFENISGPRISVSVSYQATVTTAVGVNIAYGTKITDTVNGWNGSQYAVAVPGKYRWSSHGFFGMGAGASGRLALHKGGVLNRYLGGYDNAPAGGSNHTWTGEVPIDCLAGDIISVRSSGGVGPTLFGTSDFGTIIGELMPTIETQIKDL